LELFDPDPFRESSSTISIEKNCLQGYLCSLDLLFLLD
jgi:hypothetical protein